MPPKEIPDELVDQLLAGRVGPGAITGPDGLLKQLTKRVVERATSAELTEHLGYELGEEPAEGQPNRRNGLTSKTLITEHGPVEVELPRDREGSFEPQIVPKHQRRFAGFDDKIISMYARGMSTREISKHLEEIYGVEVGRDTISRVRPSRTMLSYLGAVMSAFRRGVHRTRMLSGSMRWGGRSCGTPGRVSSFRTIAVRAP